jgi:hypothetical protein
MVYNNAVFRRIRSASSYRIASFGHSASISYAFAWPLTAVRPGPRNLTESHPAPSRSTGAIKMMHELL